MSFFFFFTFLSFFLWLYPLCSLSVCCHARFGAKTPKLSLSHSTMDTTAAARRLAAVNRHLGGGGAGETAGGETTTTEQQHSATPMALLPPPPPSTIISPSAVSASRPAFRADRLLDGQVRK